MSLRFRKRGALVLASAGLALTLLGSALVSPSRQTAVPPLRVCSDPNNLPFSNERREGFENKIAELLATELGTRVEYTWAPMWRGFIRKTVGAGRCDVIMGIPADNDRLITTHPYYRSIYVFLSRKDHGLRIHSFDDPALRRLKIGIHFIGDDYSNPPPAHALGRRGIVQNVVGYSIYGDYSKPNPPADLVNAVARRDVDVAILWGPFAGYFAPRTGVPMTLTPVSPVVDSPGVPFSFPISVGVRRDRDPLRMRLDAALQRSYPRIQRILRHYGVPLVSDFCGGTKETACE